LRKDTQSLADYQRYSGNLTRLYGNIKNTTNKRDLAQLYVNKANILTLLGEDNPDSIFTQISYGYSLDSVSACKLINHFDRVGTYGFRDRCKRIDSLNWLVWCNICHSVMGKFKKEKDVQLRIDSALYLRLIAIRADDQMYRKTDSLFRVYRREQRQLDSMNLVKIQEIIQMYGYPGHTLVGGQSMTAFLVIQHADLRTREQFLPHIKKAVKEKELSVIALRMVLDRIYLDKYNTQIWGSQQIWSEKEAKYVPAPIDTSKEALALKKEIDDM
jgi:hypothetical protein